MIWEVIPGNRREGTGGEQIRGDTRELVITVGAEGMALLGPSEEFAGMDFRSAHLKDGRLGHVFPKPVPCWKRFVPECVNPPAFAGCAYAWAECPHSFNESCMSEKQRFHKACLRRDPGVGTLAMCLALHTTAVLMSAGPKNVAQGTNHLW